MTRRARSIKATKKFCPLEDVEKRLLDLGDAIELVCYTGNPLHKRNPGDFGLTPPAAARLGKTLCEPSGITTRAAATELLRTALRCGMFSQQEREGWPQNVWAVTADGMPLECQRDAAGAYHGYPMPTAEPFSEQVIEQWNRRTSQ